MKRTETKLLGPEILAYGGKIWDEKQQCARVPHPEEPRTHFQLQCYADAAAEVMGDKSQAMSWQRFQQTEERVLRKLRIRLCNELGDEIREAAMAVIFPSDRRVASCISRGNRSGELKRSE